MATKTSTAAGSHPATAEALAAASKTVIAVDRPATFAERAFPFLALPALVCMIAFVALLPMTWQQQVGFGVLSIAAAWVLHRSHRGRVVTLTIATFSLCATMRYAFWRGNTLAQYLFSPWQRVPVVSAVLMVLLFAAELYSFTILVLGFMQTIAPLRRPVKPMPADRSLWPTVDIMIPTYNEPLDIVKYTAMAAQAIDWPQDRLTLTILDDGEREEFRRFAAEAGIGYIARTEHSGAKAGNLNNAIEQTLGEYVAIFDCDHVPTRSFLQLTMGWFLADTDLALMQTPHHFYSPDPFERNLDQFRTTPNEGSLFYGIVQDSNDLWNATFFCGSCAVLRRSALEEVGGIAQETVTEDAHTSLRLQRAGWNTAYINIAQAAGLATETLSGHVRQRIRWARGMAQILRTDNPLFGRGLRLSQRLCYLNATMHYLYGIPRMLFLTAPLLYLFFGVSNVPGYWAAILAFALPHLVLSTMANSRVQGGHRHSFWNEVYETVLAPYILIPTTVALIAPKHGTFNVTAKGGLQEDSYFDRKIARPFLILAGLNLIGLCLAIPRYLYWDHDHAATIAINVFWTLFNLVMLGTALAVCYEQKQRRESNRVDCTIPVRLHTKDGVHAGTATNLSNGGLAVRAPGSWKQGMQVHVEFPEHGSEVRLTAEVVAHKGKQVRFTFVDACLEQQRLLAEVLYSAPNRWSSWYGHNNTDRPLLSLGRIFSLSMKGFWRVAHAPGSLPIAEAESDDAALSGASGGRAIATLLLVICTVMGRQARGATATKPQPSHEATSSAPVISQVFNFGMMNGDALLLNKPGSRASVSFVVPDTWLVRGGTLRLRYSLPDQESKGASPIAEIRLNDVLLGSVTPTATEYTAGAGEAVIPVPGEVLVRKNILTLQLAGNASSVCSRAAQSVTPLRVDPASQVTLDAQPLHLASDLRSLPHPFLEHLAVAPSVIPIVFARQPSTTALQAAGLIASWFGVQESDTPKHFPVAYGALPRGNAVILIAGSDSVPGLTAVADLKRSVAMVDNPADPYGKLLILHGESEDDLLQAAQSFVLGQKQLSGDAAALHEAMLPAIRNADDAPRWVHNDRTPLSQLMTDAERRTTDSNPFNLYMHLSPDYDFGAQQRMYLHANYTTDAHALAPSSNVTARFNGQVVDSYPLVAGRAPKSLDVPVVEIPAAVYANTLQLQFFFSNSGSPCAPHHGTNNAQLLGSSFIDMGGAVHQASMPNLKLFAKAGFPFTRKADLSDTVVLMPDAPSAEAVTMFLDLMSYFGEQTGFPAYRLEVGSIAEADQYTGKDELVLGTYDDLGAAPKLGASLPLTIDGDGAQFKTLGRLGFLSKAFSSFNLKYWSGLQDSGTHAADGLVAGFQSPFGAGHSVVLVLASRTDQLAVLTGSMIQAMPGDSIDASVTLLEDGSFHSYPLFTPTYFLGTLPWHSSVRYRLSENPVLLLALLLCAVSLVAVWMSHWLQFRIRRRLRLLHEPLHVEPRPEPLT